MEQDRMGLYLDITGEWRPANPKLAGSGIVACRPQVGDCPGRCADCFYRGGRYYEDLGTPHIPDPEWTNGNGLLVRMNDGNDSNHERDLVIEAARKYNNFFFNTRIPRLDFPGPVVLTVNGDYTDKAAWLVPPSEMRMLMAVRVRVNTWNLDLVDRVIEYYTAHDIPVRLTYMAYYAETVQNPDDYLWKKRTLNNYWVIRDDVRAAIECARYRGHGSLMVHSCGTRKGYLCRDCMLCTRVYRDWQCREVIA